MGAMLLARLTLDAIGELFTEARGIMDWLARVARAAAKQGQPVSWVTPLGLPVSQPYRDVKRFTVHTMLQSVTLVRQNTDLPVHKARQRSAFPPNFVHSLDSAHMMLTALEMESRGLSFAAVHDSFWTHAADVDVMNEVLRDRFVHLYKTRDVLEDLRDSLLRRFPDVDFPELPPRGTLNLDDVRDSTYFFA